MRRIMLFFSVALIVIGLLGRLFGSQSATVSPQGVLQESIWLPIGTLLVFIGVVLLLILAVMTFIGRSRREDRSE